MQFIQDALFLVAAVLLLVALYQIRRGDWRRVMHLIADAALFVYVGYVGVGPLPPPAVIIVGAILVSLLLAISGWLYARVRQQANSALALLGALAVSGVTVAYFLGYLQ